MELLEAFLSWTWARHHNILSLYIRPLFLLPLCCFAYRRSVKGMALSLLALATGMFWATMLSSPPVSQADSSSSGISIVDMHRSAARNMPILEADAH